MTQLQSIAAAQTIPVRGNVEANTEAHIRLAFRASQEGADVVAFPELSLTGYELDLADQLAFTEDDPRLDPLVESSASSGITLVVGAPVRVDSVLHIGAFIIAPEGTIWIYTKHHVHSSEEGVFQVGDLNPLFQAGGARASVAVCADLTHPVHAGHAAARGANTYLACAFIGPSAFERDTTYLQTYASQHGLAVVLANFGGPSGGTESAGGSSIWSDEGTLLARHGELGEGLVVATQTDAGWRARAIGQGELPKSP